MKSTPPDAGRTQRAQYHTWDARWERRREEIIAEITPALRSEHPDLPWQQLHVLIEKRADMRLIYDRFGNEP